MHVLVTGANGFLGRHVVRALVDRGHRVRALVRPSSSRRANASSSNFSSDVEVATADLRRKGSIDAALAGADVIVHLAACVTGDDENQFVNTVVGTENLLDAMVEHGIGRLVHCSSFSVYDWRRSSRTLDEEAPLESRLYQRDGYAVAKSWQERIVRRYAISHDWALTILRPGFIWGPGNEQIAGTGASFGKLHVVFGRTRRLPTTYVENCAECFALAMEKQAHGVSTLNVVDDELPRASEFTKRGLKALGQPGVVVPVPYVCGMTAARAASAVSSLCFRAGGKLPSLLVPGRFQARFRPLRFSNAAAKNALGWQPRWDYESAWKRTTARLETSSSSRSSESSAS
jgi:nucleoside-diphosphate-sugar epimerase